MEKEGLSRTLQYLSANHLTVDVLIMDRHRQINKWIRETYPSIAHYFDVWHVAKGKTIMHKHLKQLKYLLYTFRTEEEITRVCKTEGVWPDCSVAAKYC